MKRGDVLKAKDMAKVMQRAGKLSDKDIERFIIAAAVVIEKGARKGWDSKKIMRRIKTRMAMRKIWHIGKAISPKLFGGALVSAGDSIEAITDKIIKERAK